MTVINQHEHREHSTSKRLPRLWVVANVLSFDLGPQPQEAEEAIRPVRRMIEKLGRLQPHGFHPRVVMVHRDATQGFLLRQGTDDPFAIQEVLDEAHYSQMSSGLGWPRKHEIKNNDQYMVRGNLDKHAAGTFNQRSRDLVERLGGDFPEHLRTMVDLSRTDLHEADILFNALHYVVRDRVNIVYDVPKVVDQSGRAITD